MMGIYLDHNATTPVDPAVLDEMLPYLGELFGNPSSIHAFGQEARRGLDLARERVAQLIGADPDEIVFTSGGTEANNHAIHGVLAAAGRTTAAVVTSAIEHQAVLEPCREIEDDGVAVTYLPVDANGVVDVSGAGAAIGPGTTLVTVMTANNDVGAVQPIERLAAAAHEHGIPFHTDAVQAVGKLALNVGDLGVDLLSCSSHKLYGPKGAGALYVKHGTPVEPLLRGGHHESRRRAGTENLPAIVGFGMACELAMERLDADGARVAGLRDRLAAGIGAAIPDARVLGLAPERLPGTLCVGFPGLDAEQLLMALDLLGVACSTGSACTADSLEPSHVLAAMGVDDDLARGAIRFSLGRGNTESEIDEAIRVVTEVVGRLRGA